MYSILSWFRVGCAGEYLPQAIIRTEVSSCKGKMFPVFEKNRDETEQYRYIVRFFKQIFFRYIIFIIISFSST